MRADRLVAIVLLLQTHGQLTASQLAERLESSVRTIRRDLDALAMAGVPVYAQRGRGGGWALLGGHRIDLSGLTVDEAQALFLATAPGPGSGLGEAGLEAALRKVTAALPAPMREQVEAARHAVLVDHSRWGEQPPPAPPHLETLRRAVVRRVQVEVRYARPGRAVEDRTLHPHGLVVKRGVWYLVATSERGLRTYRVDRVQGVQLTGRPAAVPELWDLAAVWDQLQRDLPERVSTLEVALDVEQRMVGVLQRALGGWGRVVVDEKDHGKEEGRVCCRAWFPSPAVAAAELAGFGSRVHVLGPREVRDALARIGAELVEAYPVL